ncbi:hypothetical protein PHYBLDRAFT_161492 [Phycomyces blakesleeanus NRRL 1555(-)]|uniref:Uncharacterized protein n=1 Tax=Phycomyces blakesleeanus (strain ATCC 8743b / DSM 1359 / FGSC 10004 / NBRC 33097 / NRRL 1555) TaxID=763407 RepID=A0A167R4Y9_PHYB8|nr:hypothetical protein PHYBLDRAFT_161492 [Phycomyces blakesleeanus NRRL 1555(-)]OAD80854.1 hypothetical protein PHYBLDRAFT_161492 [Phycomyces blakesleeanus NRRL 1555(-)]|eukprot:XP_018298894.1 hypothetical protein PHYBLDRAFT_161492 [Phycomyces blakesleeanus NRRL 1555(-)]
MQQSFASLKTKIVKILVKQFIDVNQAMIQQSLTEKVLVEGLEETLDNIAGSGLLSLEDCPTSKSDPLYERQYTHRVINENEITDIVMEKYDADNNAANNNSNEEIVEVKSAVPFKRTYSASEKFECVCTLLNILEDKDINRDFVKKKVSSQVQSKLDFVICL